MVTFNDSIPLYAQISTHLRDAIEDGTYKAGDRLPSERELAEQFQVSTITVKRAVLDLVQEGLVYRKRGKGTFVAEPKLERDLGRLNSFTKEMLYYGVEPGNLLIRAELVKATGRVAQALKLESGQEVVLIERTRLADGEPLMLEKAFLPHKIFPGILEEDLSERSLYDVISNRFDVALASARETLEPIIINSEEAEKLKVEKGTPGLLLELTAFSQTGEPVEYCKAIVRGDRSKYYIELGGFRKNGWTEA